MIAVPPRREAMMPTPLLLLPLSRTWNTTPFTFRYTSPPRHRHAAFSGATPSLPSPSKCFAATPRHISTASRQWSFRLLTCSSVHAIGFTPPPPASFKTGTPSLENRRQRIMPAMLLNNMLSIKFVVTFDADSRYDTVQHAQDAPP